MRPARVLPGAALLALLPLLATACTGPQADQQTGQQGARDERSAPEALVPALRGEAPSAVLDGGTAGALSVQLSAALYDTSPVVVLARADDAPGLEQARGQAARLGVPLLVADPPAAAPGGATPEPATADPALLAELQRLRPQAVLALGPAADLPGLPGRVVRRPEDLPRLAPVHPTRPGTTVLLPADADPATTALAQTAAGAAGAAVVPVRGGDVRADPAAVAALAGGPRRVLAVGAQLGPLERLQARLAVAATGVQLPGGGQAIAGRRFVALYGTPGSPSLGVLGEQGLEAAVSRAEQVAAPYRALGPEPVVPSFELIATVASGSAGRDGDFSTELAVEALRPWVERAGAAGMYVVLDLQPGRADFLSQARQYAPLLELPHVGLALDPEWRLGPDQVPLQQIGSVGVDEVNDTLAWLAGLTREHALPQKLVVLHQFRLAMLRDEARLDLSHDELQLLVHMDGQGATGDKDGTWGAVTRAAPAGVLFGWKNFYDEDAPVLTPAQTMTRRPTPSMISYQ